MTKSVAIELLSTKYEGLLPKIVYYIVAHFQSHVKCILRRPGFAYQHVNLEWRREAGRDQN